MASRADPYVVLGVRADASDEELGYIKTDDSFSKILADAGASLSEQLAELFDDARDEIKRRRS